MILSDFPVKGGEGIYRSKIRKQGSGLVLLIHKDMVRDMGIQEGQRYLCKAKRICDAYCEENILLEAEKCEDADYPLRARLPSYTMLSAGSKLYITLEPFDLAKWFRAKKAKGFGTDEGATE